MEGLTDRRTLTQIRDLVVASKPVLEGLIDRRTLTQIRDLVVASKPVTIEVALQRGTVALAGVGLVGRVPGGAVQTLRSSVLCGVCTLWSVS